MEQTYDEGPFYKLNDLEWAKKLEEKWSQIRKELEGLLHLPAAHGINKHWFAAHPHYVKGSEGKTGISWKTYEFMFFGIRRLDHLEKCPITKAALAEIPNLVTAQFSMLSPNSSIAAHKGYTKMVWRCHLPLIVPEPELCGLKVDGKTTSWKEGNLIAFNDSLEHEAWNNGSEFRAVLMFDIAHPEMPYSSAEICEYKLRTTEDPFLLDIAPSSEWLKWLKQGYFPMFDKK